MHKTKEKNMSIDEELIGVPKEEYGAEYHGHVLEMYKLYVEMADKISERRQSGNSFFLTLNSAIVALVGYVNLSDNPTQGGGPVFWLIPVAGMVLCYLWYRLIRSYKDINSGKFKVVHAIEKILPLHPYDAEWTALGRGENPKLYLPFTNTEMVVPWIFFTIHLAIGLISIIEFIR
jgi:hypothetical protein